MVTKTRFGGFFVACTISTSQPLALGTASSCHAVAMLKTSWEAEQPLQELALAREFWG